MRHARHALAALALSLTLTQTAAADDAHHPERAMPPAATANPVDTMQRNADMMRAQLEAIAAAKEPAEQQKLLAEHMLTMRENMMLGQQMMAGQAGCPMMGGAGGMGMMGSVGGMGMMGGMPADTVPADMGWRLQQMERRMDMMQMMMERMTGPAPRRQAK